MKYVWKTLDIRYPNSENSLRSSDEISKYLDSNYNILKFDIEDFLADEYVQLQIKKFAKIRPDVDLPLMLRTLYKNLSGISVHAGGIVIVDPSENIVPLVPLVDNDIAPYASAFGESGSTKELESIGKIKFDMLGLANLRMLHDVVRSVAAGFGMPEKTIYNKIDPNEMDLEIPEVYESFREGYTEGIFQFSSDGMTKLLNDFEVESIYDLGICNALYRPGPLQNGFDELVIAAKRNPHRQGTQYSAKLYELIKDILTKTYSYPVFEEQIGLIGQRIGDFDDSQLNGFRKFLKDGKVIKISNPEAFRKKEEEFHDQFITNGLKKGLDEDEIEQLWSSLVQFSDYSFNASHALSYSLLAYQTQYFNTVYPGYWYSAVLNQTKDAAKMLPNIMRQIRQRGISIQFKMPQIRNIHDQFAFKMNGDDPSNGTVFIGFSSIKGMGEVATENLKSDAFKTAQFNNIEELLEVCKENKFRAVNKTVLLTMANIGMLEEFGSMQEVRAQILIEKDKDYRVELDQDEGKKRKKYRPMNLDEAMEKDFQDNHTDDLFFYQAQQEAIGTSFMPNPAMFLKDKVEELSNNDRFDGLHIDAGVVSDVKLKLSKRGTQYYTIRLSSISNPEPVDYFVWEKSFKVVGEDKLEALKKFDKVLIVGHENTWDERRDTTYNVDEIIIVE